MRARFLRRRTQPILNPASAAVATAAAARLLHICLRESDDRLVSTKIVAGRARAPALRGLVRSLDEGSMARRPLAACPPVSDRNDKSIFPPT